MSFDVKMTCIALESTEMHDKREELRMVLHAGD